MLKCIRDYYLKILWLDSEEQGVNPLQELVDQLSKERACFPLLLRGDDGEPNCTLPKPCSHFSCHIRSCEQSAGVDRDRTGVGSRRWMPSPRWCWSFGSSTSVMLESKTHGAGKVDGRADYGLAGSSGCSCSTWEEADRFLPSIISRICRI